MACLVVNDKKSTNFILMLLQIHPENPQERFLQQAVSILKKGGVIIYPTDTVYGLGCDVYSKKAIEQICRIKNLNPKKAEFSVVCRSLSDVSQFTFPLSNQTFKMMKQTLPGPFTYILKANNKLPDTFRAKKKTIGIRIPNNTIALQLTELLGNPIISTSLNKYEDDIREYYTNPELIYERYQSVVDCVIDGGSGGLEPSTIIDASKDPFTIVRQGKGEIII